MNMHVVERELIKGQECAHMNIIELDCYRGCCINCDNHNYIERLLSDVLTIPRLYSGEGERDSLCIETDVNVTMYPEAFWIIDFLKFS